MDTYLVIQHDTYESLLKPKFQSGDYVEIIGSNLFGHVIKVGRLLNEPTFIIKFNNEKCFLYYENELRKTKEEN